ncbi:MAG: alkaline phosphatase family protein [Chloroflexi bacterium]|nr:alkaline phosphatase family protein [Chloroflexota bacterium]
MRHFFCAFALLLCACASAPPSAPPLVDTAIPATTPTETASPAPPPTVTPLPTSTTPPTATMRPPPPKVLIISIDGLRPDALLKADAPNIMALAHRGAYTWSAQTIYPAVTLPAHASMLTGYPPEAHGILWNDNSPGHAPVKVPTIFSAAHAAGLRTVMVVGKQKLEQLNLPGTVDAYVFARFGDPGAADAAIEEIGKGFDLMFVHLPNTDYFGHTDGWMSPTYIAELTPTDAAVGRILAALPPDTIVILTADHGGHDKVHGARIPVDMTIPWIIAGPGVAADHELAAPVNTMDTAATVAYVLGLALPPDAAGVPVLEALGNP